MYGPGSKLLCVLPSGSPEEHCILVLSPLEEFIQFVKSDASLVPPLSLMTRVMTRIVPTGFWACTSRSDVETINKSNDTAAITTIVEYGTFQIKDLTMYWSVDFESIKIR